MLEIAHVSTRIDPPLPFHMEGYQDRVATSIHDHLQMNSICIQQETCIMLHVLDIIMIPKELAQQIKKESAERFQLSEDQVIITCIHTHSGPTVSNLITKDIQVDQHYLNTLLETALANTEQCLQQLFPAKIYYGTTTIEGYFCNRNGKDLPFNPTAYIWKITDEANQPRFSIAHMGCHPTVLHAENLSISADFIGEMRTAYEESAGIPLIFLNAEGGDVSTRLVRKGSSFEETARVGTGIAQRLLQTSCDQQLKLHHQRTSSYTLTIDYDPKQDEWLCEHLDHYQKELDRLPVDDPRHANLKFMFYDNLKRIYDKEHIFLQPTCWVVEFDDFRFATIPGELVYELGRRMREVDDKPMFLLTYSNDFNIYAVNKEQYGTYFESFNTNYPFGKADEMIEQTISLYKK